MILEDKGNLPIFVMFLVAFVFSVLLFLENLKVKGSFINRAMLRKEKARLKNNRAWSITLCFMSILVVLSVTLVHSYINKPVELTPAQPYQEEGNKIIIPLTDIEDGHLHRFSYKATGGNDVRSEEHTSELQSRQYLVCRLLLEKKTHKCTLRSRH